jgi:[ribosomal protein S18]-alanine N-acetyltransferase
MAGVRAHIRNFEPEDFDYLWQIDQECFSPGISYSRQELKAHIRRRGSFTLVAAKEAALRESGRKIAAPADNPAQIQGFIVAYGGPIGHIITIDVIAPARRSGLGSRLLTAAEDRLRAEGSHSVGLEAAVDNHAAITFYKRHGYNIVGTWPRYYSNGVDALAMRKPL